MNDHPLYISPLLTHSPAISENEIAVKGYNIPKNHNDEVTDNMRNFQKMLNENRQSKSMDKSTSDDEMQENHATPQHRSSFDANDVTPHNPVEDEGMEEVPQMPRSMNMTPKALFQEIPVEDPSIYQTTHKSSPVHYVIPNIEAPPRVKNNSGSNGVPQSPQGIDSDGVASPKRRDSGGSETPSPLIGYKEQTPQNINSPHASKTPAPQPAVPMTLASPTLVPQANQLRLLSSSDSGPTSNKLPVESGPTSNKLPIERSHTRPPRLAGTHAQTGPTWQTHAADRTPQTPQTPQTPVTPAPGPILPLQPVEAPRSGATPPAPQAPKANSTDKTLLDIAMAGDMRQIERIAFDLARLAQGGDVEGVLELLRTPVGCDSVTSLSSVLSGLSTEAGEREREAITFSHQITTVRPVAQHTYTVDHIPSGLSTQRPDQAQLDAQLLVTLTQPLLEAAGTRTPSHGLSSYTAELSQNEIRVLMDALLAVCHHVKKITTKESRLLDIPSPCYVLGDIHGNLKDLEFFRQRIWPNDPQVTGGDFLFLGDFVDRGLDSIPVVAYIMAMKVLNPNKWWLIRGNHETREVNGNIEHYQQGSFLSQCIQAFGERDGRIVWEAVNTFFDTLPLAATIDNQIFCVHGGIPRELCSVDATLDMIRNVEVPLRTAQNNQMVYDMLWSDPSTPEQEGGPDLDRGGFGMSPRGCSCFGERSLDIFLSKYSFQHVFRGHEAQKSGVGVSKSARLTTIFSTSRDHFPGDVPATCGCVIVDHGCIRPVVRAIPTQEVQQVQLKPTYVQQSIEATDHTVLENGSVYPVTHGQTQAPGLQGRMIYDTRVLQNGHLGHHTVTQPGSNHMQHQWMLQQQPHHHLPSPQRMPMLPPGSPQRANFQPQPRQFGAPTIPKQYVTQTPQQQQKQQVPPQYSTWSY